MMRVIKSKHEHIGTETLVFILNETNAQKKFVSFVLGVI